MALIFISYRREDSADICGRLYDRLEARFGHANVFKDVDNIPTGVDFRTHVRGALQQSDVVLAVIGPRWLSSANSQGQPRLFEPEDFVRIEIEVALQLHKVIIPVLVNNAMMPGSAALPASISALAYINASRLRADPDFRHDCDALITSISAYVPMSSQQLVQPLAADPPRAWKRLPPTAAYPLTSAVAHPLMDRAPIQSAKRTRTSRIYRSVLLAIGLLAFAFWVSALAIQYGVQGHPTTLTLYILPAVCIGLDVVGSIMAAVIAISVRRGIWILWLLLLNIFPLGFAPLVYGAFGPM